MSTALYIVPDREKMNYTANDLVSLYTEECNLQALPFVHRMINEYLQAGFEDLMIAEAIMRTAMAPKPSWYYLQAIMRNCKNTGIYTYDDFVSKNHRREKSRKRTAFQDYQQREYTEEELLSVSDDLISEARESRTGTKKAP